MWEGGIPSLEKFSRIVKLKCRVLCLFIAKSYLWPEFVLTLGYTLVDNRRTPEQ